jgi:hypothetical protein
MQDELQMPIGIQRSETCGSAKDRSKEQAAILHSEKDEAKPGPLASSLQSFQPFADADKVFQRGWLAVCVYIIKVDDRPTFCDLVIYRRVKTPDGGRWKRGSNLKPEDVDQLVPLLHAAKEFSQHISVGI